MGEKAWFYLSAVNTPCFDIGGLRWSPSFTPHLLIPPSSATDTTFKLTFSSLVVDFCCHMCSSFIFSSLHFPRHYFNIHTHRWRKVLPDKSSVDCYIVLSSPSEWEKIHILHTNSKQYYKNDISLEVLPQHSENCTDSLWLIIIHYLLSCSVELLSPSLGCDSNCTNIVVLRNYRLLLSCSYCSLRAGQQRWPDIASLDMSGECLFLLTMKQS